MIFFTCKSCGKNEVEEVVINATVYYPIDIISASGIEYTPLYHKPIIENGIVSHYQCCNCGSTVTDENGIIIENEEDLIDLLAEEE